MRKNLFSLLFIAHFIEAEEIALEPVTVYSGTKTEKLFEEAPVKTEVISSKQIEEIHARDVAEALKYMPNLSIKETHGKQGQSVWMQGVNSDRVLILIDGEVMTSPTGSTVDISQISTSDIEKIEIIKGAASALYGSQAMGGVINIITKNPKSGLKNTLWLTGGSYGDKNAGDYGSYNFRGNHSYADDAHELLVDYSVLKDDGVKLQDGYSTDLPKQDQVNLNAKYTYKTDNANWYITPRYYGEKTDSLFQEYNPPFIIDGQKIETSEKYRLSMGTDMFFGEDILKVSAMMEQYVSDTDIDYVDTSYLEQTRNLDSTLKQAQIQYDKTVFETHLLTLGGNFTQESMEQSNLKNNGTSIIEIPELTNDAKRSNNELFFQDDWFVSDSFEVLPGVRYQYDSDFGAYISPKIALFKHINIDDKRINFRLSYGNGYKVPTLKERFFIFDNSIYGYKLIGNPDLKPEESTSFQFSTEVIQKGVYSLAINLFNNKISNLITTTRDTGLSVSEGLEVYNYQNIDAALTRGVEVEWNKTMNEFWQLNGGYVYLYAKDETTDLYLTERPEHQFTLSTTLSYASYVGFLGARWESEEYVDLANTIVSPSKNIIDIKLTKHVTPVLDFYGGVNNLLDEHRDPNDFISDLRTKSPRYVYLGVKYTF